MPAIVADRIVGQHFWSGRSPLRVGQAGDHENHNKQADRQPGTQAIADEKNQAAKRYKTVPPHRATRCGEAGLWSPILKNNPS